tara:strand:+ start:7559 stop:8194 length:636 start_codon:yes stop_codon:yes gene_type:complete
MDINNQRIEYSKDNIDFSDPPSHPLDLFKDWFSFELKHNLNEANACVLSTVNNDNIPSSRVILLKQIVDSGFIFFTNYQSSKAIHISNNSNVALNFYWHNSERQVRVSGKAKKISASDSDIYFKQRPIDSKIGAWVSSQSKIINMDHQFTEEVDKIKREFLYKEIERPKFWGGYCIEPIKIEFWQGRPSRLHDRLLYSFINNNWLIQRLSP